MNSQSFNCCKSDNNEIEALELFGEEYRVEIYETIYNLYELDLPLEVAQKLIELENRWRTEPMRLDDEYEQYLTDYYSEWAEEYERRNQQSQS